MSTRTLRKRKAVEEPEQDVEDKKQVKRRRVETKAETGKKSAPKKAKKNADELDVQESEVLERVDILGCGSSEVGQLGLGDEHVESMGLKPAIDMENIDLVCIAVGGGATALVKATKEGKKELWTWGCNDDGVLGRTGVESEPGKVETEEDFVHLSMGEYHMAGVTADGKLYTWGTYKDANGYMGFDGEGNQKQGTPKLYEAIKEKIVSVASNENITYALTASGHVYEWGNTNAIVNRSSTRKTIRDQTKKDCLHPQQVYLGSIKVRKLCQANHGYHMFLFDNQQKVYGWGLNNHGQLGLGDEENRSRPTKLKAFNDVEVEFVCTGQHHSLALSKDHKVYSWGRGDYGQLGHGDDEKRLEPTVIQFFDNLEGGDHVVQIACGANHSLALTKSGKIYSWGFGESYQLGHGPKKPKEGEAENPANEEHLPRLVVSRALTNTRTPLVALGGGIHTAVIARKMPKADSNAMKNSPNTELKRILALLL